MKLNIGGTAPATGWAIMHPNENVEADYKGDFGDLDQFDDGSVEAIYSCHMLQRLGYSEEIPNALAECKRILAPGGEIMISVPDMVALAVLFVHEKSTPEHQWHLMRILFGGETDDDDFNATGMTADFLASFLTDAGFEDIQAVDDFGLFDDVSTEQLNNIPVSLNMKAKKPA
jgi:predicted SAM-dependent methyltransferase